MGGWIDVLTDRQTIDRVVEECILDQCSGLLGNTDFPLGLTELLSESY